MSQKTAPAPAQTRAQARWGDLNAAVSHAADSHEMAPVVTQDDSPLRRVYTLVTIRDEPVTIVFERAEGAPDDEPVEVAILVRVGRFGDTARERAITETLRPRLRWLMGRN